MSKFAKLIVAGIVPTSDEGIGDEATIYVRMTLGDYRAARIAAHLKSPELPALKAAERFINDELRCRDLSYLPNPTDAEYADLAEVLRVKRIVQAAIVKAEIGK